MGSHEQGEHHTRSVQKTDFVVYVFVMAPDQDLPFGAPEETEEDMFGTAAVATEEKQDVFGTAAIATGVEEDTALR